MSDILVQIKNGYLVSLNPVDLPEGQMFRVSGPVPSELEIEGMTELEQGTDPEAIARWLAEFDAIEPLRMTADEEANWQAARKAQRDFELATADARFERLRDAIQ